MSDEFKTFRYITTPGKLPTIASLAEHAIVIGIGDRVVYTRHGDNIVQLGVSPAQLAAAIAASESTMQTWVNSTRPTRETLGIDNVQNYGISNSFTLDSGTSYASSKALYDAYQAIQQWVTTNRPTRASLEVENVQNYGISDSYELDSSESYASSKALFDGMFSITSNYEPRISGLETSVSTLNTDTTTLRNDADQLRIDTDNANATASNAQSRVAAEEVKGSNRDLKITDIESKNAEQDTRLDNNDVAQDAQDVKISDIETAATALTGRVATNETALATAQTDIIAVTDQTTTNTNEIAVLKASSDNADVDLTDLTARVTVNETDIDTVESDIAGINTALNTKADKVDQDATQAALTVAEGEIDAIEVTLAGKASKATTDTLRIDVDAVTATANQNTTDIATQTAGLSAHVTDTANPHGTTKDHLDLGLVENFAPSSAVNEDVPTQHATSRAVYTVNERVTTEVTALTAYVDSKIAELLGGAPAEALDTIAELATALTDNDSDIAAITSTLATKADITTTDQLQTDLTAAESAIASNVAELVTVKARVTTLESTSGDHETRLLAEEAATIAQATKNGELDTTITALQATDATAATAINAHADEIDLLKAADVAMTGRADSLRTDTDANTANIVTAQSDISDLEVATTTLTTENATRAAEIVSVDDKAKTLADRADAVDIVNSTQSTNISNNTSAINSLQTVTAGHTSELAGHDGRLDESESDIDSLESRADANDALNTTQNGRLSTLESRADAADVEASSVDARVTSNTDSITNHESRIGIAESAISDQQTIDEGLRTDTDKNTSDISAVNTNITAMQNNIGNLGTDKAAQADLDAHVNNQNNPHGMTKATIDLDNVQNFTISDSVTLDSSNSYASSKSVYLANANANTARTDSIAHTDAKIAELLGGAPAAALDTIAELAAALTANDSDIASIITTLAGKASIETTDAITVSLNNTKADVANLQENVRIINESQAATGISEFYNLAQNRSNEDAGSGYAVLGGSKPSTVNDIEGLVEVSGNNLGVNFTTRNAVARINGVRLVLSTMGSKDANGNSLIPLPAPTDGLDKADGTGRFADYAAAVAAGGNSLSESITDDINIIVLRKTARGSEHNITVTGHIYPEGNLQSTEATYKGHDLTVINNSPTLNSFGVHDTSPAGHALSVETLGDEVIGVIADNDNNILNDNGILKQVVFQHQVHRLNRIAGESVSSMMTRIGYSKVIGKKGVYSITNNGVVWEAIPFVAPERYNLGLSAPVGGLNVNGVRGNASEAWTRDPASVTMLDLFQGGSEAPGKGLVADTISGHWSFLNRFADEVKLSAVRDLRMHTERVDSDKIEREFTDLAYRGMVRGFDLAPYTHYAASVNGLALDEGIAFNGKDSWLMKISLADNTKIPTIADVNQGDWSAWIGIPDTMSEGVMVKCDIIYNDFTDIIVAVEKSAYVTSPFDGMTSRSDLSLAYTNMKAKPSVGLEPSNAVHFGTVASLAALFPQGAYGIYQGYNAPGNAHHAIELVKRPTGGVASLLEKSVETPTLTKIADRAVGINTSSIPGTLTSSTNAHGVIVYTCRADITRSSDSLKYDTLGNVFISTDYQVGSLLAESLANIQLKASEGSYLELPLTSIGSRDYANASFVKDGLGRQPAHTIYRTADDLPFENDTDAMKSLSFVDTSREQMVLGFAYKQIRYDVGYDDPDVIPWALNADSIDLALTPNPKIYINPSIALEFNDEWTSSTLLGKTIVYVGNSLDNITASDMKSWVLDPASDKVLDANGGVTGWEYWDGAEWGDDGKINIVPGSKTTSDINGFKYVAGIGEVELPYFTS